MSAVKLSTRLRQDPILLATTIVMAIGVIVAVGLMAWWTMVLTPYYPTQPCAPDAAKVAALWISSL
jgi:hypothetical protein